MLVERVRELENALEQLHEAHHACSDETRDKVFLPHPLLTQEKLFIKSTMDLHSEGTLGRVPLVRKDRQRKAETKNQAAATLHLAPTTTNGSPLSSASPSNPPSTALLMSPATQDRELNLITDIVASAFVPVLSAAFDPSVNRRPLALQKTDEQMLKSDLYQVVDRDLIPRDEAESLISLMDLNGAFLYVMLHLFLSVSALILFSGCNTCCLRKISASSCNHATNAPILDSECFT